MESQRFNSEKDLAPMPFDESICQRALEMKKTALHGSRMSAALCGTRMNSSHPPPLFRAEYILF